MHILTVGGAIKKIAGRWRPRCNPNRYPDDLAGLQVMLKRERESGLECDRVAEKGTRARGERNKVRKGDARTNVACQEWGEEAVGNLYAQRR